jgi:uncharacterized protein DUF6869
MTASYWETRRHPTDDEIAEVARACLRYWSSKRDRDFWGVDAMLDARQPELHEVAWRLILSLCDQADPADERLVAQIGAAPLEYFIDRYGNTAMDLIEAAAETNPTLLSALRFVGNDDDRVRPRIDRFLRAQERAAKERGQSQRRQR